MRWNSSLQRKIDNAIFRYFFVPLMWVLSPLWAPMVGLLIAVIFIDTKVSEWTAPKKMPHQWFAWRPIRFGYFTDDHGDGAWLELVWRGRDRWGDVTHAPTRESLESAQ